MKYDGKEIPAGATHYNNVTKTFHKFNGGWLFFYEYTNSWFASIRAKEPDFESELTELPDDDPYIPEVGTWCEFDCTAKGSECKNLSGYVEYMSEFTCVIKLKYPSRKAEFVAHPKTMKFRPLKTEQQRAAEAMHELVKDADDILSACEILANEGYRNGQ